MNDPRLVDRFQAARPNIENRPCLKPLRTIVWATTETLDQDPAKRWHDMGYGVFWLVGKYDFNEGEI